MFTYHTRLDAYAHYAPFDRATTERAMVELTRRYANSADAVDRADARDGEPLARARRARADRGGAERDRRRALRGRPAQRAGARAARRADGNAPLALVVSRLGIEKNVELAIDALARVPALRLAVVGEGPHRPALEERARRLGVAGRVRFVGNLARERLPDVYASADAFSFPSTTDTQGLVLAEALAAGLPGRRGRERSLARRAGRGGPGRAAGRRRDRGGAVRRICGRPRSECRTFGILAVYRRGADAANPRNLPGGAGRASSLT